LLLLAVAAVSGLGTQTPPTVLVLIIAGAIAAWQSRHYT